MKRKICIFLIILTLILVLGYIVLHKQNITETKKMLLIEKSNWKALNLETYEYTVITDSNGYTARYNSTIFVKNNYFHSETINDEYRKSIEKYSDGHLTTIDNIFDLLEEEIFYYEQEEIDLLYSYCNNITINYDTYYHIPTEIIFRNYKFPFLTDISTWETIKIQNFKEIEG